MSIKRIIAQGIEKIIPIEFLQRGQYQPRQQFDAAALQELANSIRQMGIFTPLIIRPKHANNYEIIAGERRWRAAQLAELKEVPCKILQCNNEEALQIALVENLARENLNPIEEAQGIARLVNEFIYTQEEVAESIGKPRSTIANLLRLLELHKDVQTLILKKELTESHGKLLVMLPASQQYVFAREAVVKKWSIRELDSAIKRYQKSPKKNLAKATHADIRQLERQLADYFCAAIKITEKGKGKGAVVIEYNSYDELEGIFQRCGFKETEDEVY